MPGTSIKQALVEARNLAIKLDVGIEINFNGFEILIFKHSSLIDIEARYNNYCKQPSLKANANDNHI